MFTKRRGFGGHQDGRQTDYVMTNVPPDYRAVHHPCFLPFRASSHHPLTVQL